MEYAPINLPRPGAAAAARRSDHARALRLLGHRVRLQADRARPTKRPSCSASPRAAPSRSWPTAPTKTTSSASTPSRCSSTWAPTRWPLPRKRMAIARDLFQRQETRALKPEPGLRGAAPFGRLRAARRRPRGRRPGAPDRRRAHPARPPGSGRDPLLPVPAAQQREALDLIARGMSVRPTAWRLAGACSASWRPTSTSAAMRSSAASARPTDYSLPQRCSTCSAAAGAADERRGRRAPARQRGQGRPAGESRRFRLSELYERLTREVWSELGHGGDISAPRRELQRDTSTASPPCCCARRAAARRRAQPAARAGAGLLHAHQRCGATRRAEREARAHLEDSADTLTQALAARLQRAGV